MKTKGNEEYENIKKTSRLFRGSVCVETAIVAPIFMIMTLSLFSLLEMIHIHTRINAALSESVRELSVYAYAQILDSNDDSKMITDVLGVEGYVRGRMISILGADWMGSSLIDGGLLGIHFYRSDIDRQTGEMDIVANYSVSPWISFGKVGKIHLMNRCKVKMWIGYCNPKDYEEEIYVYITPEGEVYHDSAYCPYLKPAIGQYPFESLSKLRNASGEKYRTCMNCSNEKKIKETGYVFLTRYGTKYHSSSSCKSLKRTVKRIPFSKTDGRRACSKCRSQHYKTE